MIIMIAGFTVLFSSGLLIFYLYLLGRKLMHRRYVKLKAHWLENHSEHIYSFLTTGAEDVRITPAKAYQFDALEDVFSDFLANYKIDEDTDFIRPFVERHFAPHYRRRLNDPLWSKRMNALFFIDLFQIRSMEDSLIQHLCSKRCSSEERYEIYLLLAAFESERLMELLKSANRLPAFLLNILVGRLVNEHHVDAFVDDFDRFDVAWRGAILEIIRDKHLRTAKSQQLLERLLNSEISELRVKSLKALASLGYVTSINIIIQWLDEIRASEDWESPKSTGERLMAARLMGSIREERFLPYLQTMLGDRIYGVRSEAAKAIRQYRGSSRILQRLTATHPDAFARSICQEWLERSPHDE